MSHLALLEIISTDRHRHYRSEYFPFIRPFLTGLGLDVDWYCVGVRAEEITSGKNLYIYELSDADVRTVASRLSSAQVTHLVTNERLCDQTRDAILAAMPGASLLTITGKNSEEVLPRIVAFLELPASVLEFGEGSLLDMVTPTYEREPLNELAREIKPFVHIITGPECLYEKPLASNLYFDELDLDECIRKSGCSFCFAGSSFRVRHLTSAVELALKQIRAAQRTVPKELNGQTYKIYGLSLWLNVRLFFAEILAAGIPPSAFYFSMRADEFLRMNSELERVLPELQAAGHSVVIYNMGLENFSPAENERFNKGLTAEEIELAVRILQRLEAQYPGTFDFFGKEGGFGIILYTPWTSVDDLRANIAAFRKLGLKFEGFVLDASLQLLPGLPIARLAERDGLLLRHSADYPYDSGCITDWDQYELPWRFRHSEVATIHRMGRRLSEAADVPADDPEYRRVQSWLRSLPLGRRKLIDVFEALVDCATQEVVPLDHMLTMVADRLAALDPLRAMTAMSPRTPSTMVEGPSSLRVLDASAERSSPNTLHIVRSCNLRCRTCPWETELDGAQVPTSDIDARMRDLRTLGFNHIELTGPEPTLHRALPRMVQRIRRHGFDRVTLFTNGRMLRYPRFVTQLLRSGVSEFVVSLHGSSAEIHDGETRTPGSFDDTVAGIGVAIGKCPEAVTARLVVTERNAKQAAELVEYCHLLGMRRILLDVTASHALDTVSAAVHQVVSTYGIRLVMLDRREP